MEDNSGGTPNPLNPNPTVGQNPEPVESRPTNVNQPTNINQPTDVSRPTSVSRPAGMNRPMSMNRPTSMSRPTGMGRSGMVGIDGMRRIPNVQNTGAVNSGATNSPVKPNVPNTMGVVTSLDGTPDPTTMEPASRPMEHAPNANPPKPRKRKNTGLIVGLLISLFIAVGCGVAAILLFVNGGKEDAVATAMNKLVSGNMPENVKIDGTIDININDPTSLFTSAAININTEMVTKSIINNTKASLKANLRNGSSFSIDFDEIYAANGDLYLKIDGISNILNDPNILKLETNSDEVTVKEMSDDDVNTETTVTEDATNTEALYEEVDCYIAEGCPNNEETSLEALKSLASALQMLELIDGDWIKISTDEISTLVPSSDSSNLKCLTGLVSDATNSNNVLSGMYNKNPFITSTSENLTVTSEKNPIYLVAIDNDTLKSFLNDAQNSTLVNNYNSCMGQKNAKIDVDGLITTLSQLPDFYVEVDGDHNFTRVYFETDLNDGKINAKVDLDLSYPANVNVPAPVEYKNLSDMIQELMSKTSELQVETVE